MNMKNEDFEVIKKALMLLPQGEEFENLNEENQNIIINARIVMLNLLEKKKRDNKRTAEYVAEKRLTDKAYGRGAERRELKVNHCGREAQDRMERNGWKMVLAELREEPEELYERLINEGYKDVRVYWEGTMIKGIHSYFAFVK